jgi:hypothetical protein
VDAWHSLCVGGLGLIMVSHRVLRVRGSCTLPNPPPPPVALRETAVRAQSLIKFDAMADLLAAKDAMIWRLLQERTACTSEVEAVGRASSAEIEEWKRYGAGVWVYPLGCGGVQLYVWRGRGRGRGEGVDWGWMPLMR